MSDELVFRVEEADCLPVPSIHLSEAGLTERAHLQEWVISHPEMLGPGVLVVTSEFDQWTAASETPRDRLDVLGLDTDGRLVVAELKRGHAPDTTDMQALKYAAMVSRFGLSTLADAHVAFLRQRGEQITDDEAKGRFETHTGMTVTRETLSRPRIVLLASSYSPSVTATAVWLNEMGVDVTLMRFQAYRMPSGEVAVTVSKQYPVPAAEEFAISPLGPRGERSASEEFSEVPWTAEDVTRLRAMAPNATIVTVLDMGSVRPREPVSFAEVVAQSGQTHPQARAQLAGLTMLVKRHFARSNWPLEARWAAGGEQQMYYTVDPAVAEAWLAESDPAPLPVNPDVIEPTHPGLDGNDTEDLQSP